MHEPRPSLLESDRFNDYDKDRANRTPTVYTLIVERSFVSASDGAQARVGSSARATCRNCSPASRSVLPRETFNGPSVPCVGPPPVA